MPYRKVGVDLGITGPHYISVCDEATNLVRPKLAVGTSAKDFDRIYEHALVGAEEATRLKVIFEPTGLTWLPFAIYTRAKGHLVYRVKGQQLADLRKFYYRYKKNDRFDSKAAAKMPDDTIEELYLPNSNYMALERATMQHDKLTEHLGREKLRIQALTDAFIPGVVRACGQPFSKPARVIYENLANPFTIKTLGVDQLKQLLSENSRQKVKDDKLKAIFKCAENACEIYQHGHAYIDFEQIAREVKRYYQHIVSLEALVADVEQEIQHYYQRVHPSKNIETIYGIGKTLGPVFVAVIKDAHRFSSAKKIKGFIGMIPKIDDTCGSSKKGLPITKAGPPRARRAGFIAADVARQWDPQMAKIYYDAMVHKGQTHTEALCALCNHIFVRALRVLKEDRPYELRGLNGKPIDAKTAKAFIKEHLTVPEKIRRRRRNKKRLQDKLKQKKNGHQRNKNHKKQLDFA